MTGHGRGMASSNGVKVEVELSSVNRKQMDVSVSLPRSLTTLDPLVYEEIQSDLFDHILAVIPEFGLRVFQNPTGYLQTD
jgi:hypothetical protein